MQGLDPRTHVSMQHAHDARPGPVGQLHPAQVVRLHDVTHAGRGTERADVSEGAGERGAESVLGL